MLPILSDWEDYRLQRTLHLKPRPEMLWDTGRHLFADAQGNTHIFHEYDPIRRISWDGSSDMPIPPLLPHRMRMAFHVPLKTLDAAEEHEIQRRRWFKRKVRHLQKVLTTPGSAPLAKEMKDRYRDWDRSACMHSSCSLQSGSSGDNSPTTGVSWVPADLTNETLFTKGPWRRWPSNSASDIVAETRRYSLDDVDYAYGSTDENDLPFLHEAGLVDSESSSSIVYVRRYRSYDADATDDSFFDTPASSPRSLSFDGSDAYRARDSMVYARHSSTESEAQHSQRSGDPNAIHEHGPAEEDQRSNRSTRTNQPSSFVVICLRACAAVANTLCLCGPCVQLSRGWTSAHSLYRTWLYGRRMDRLGTRGSSAADQLRKPLNEQFSCPQCDRYLRTHAATRSFGRIRPRRDRSWPVGGRPDMTICHRCCVSSTRLAPPSGGLDGA